MSDGVLIGLPPGNDVHILCICSAGYTRSQLMAAFINREAVRRGYPIIAIAAGLTNWATGKTLAPLVLRAIAKYEAVPATPSPHQVTAEEVCWAHVILGTTEDHLRQIREKLRPDPDIPIKLLSWLVRRDWEILPNPQHDNAAQVAAAAALIDLAITYGFRRLCALRLQGGRRGSCGHGRI